MKRLLLVLVIAILGFGGYWFIGKQASFNMESSIIDSMNSVYIPKSMQQFNDARRKYRGTVFTEFASDKFFVKYGENVELTENDLKREAEFFIEKSPASLNSYRKDVYFVKAFLYPFKGAEPRIRLFCFVTNKEGKIEDVVIYRDSY